MNKKILIFAFLLFLFNLSQIAFATEKIMDLKFKNEDEKRFYLVDENKNMDFGYYEGSFFFKSATISDKTLEPYYGKIDTSDIKQLFTTKINFRWSIFNTIFAFGVGTFFMPIGVVTVLFRTSMLVGILGAVIIGCAGLEFLLGFIAVGMMGFYGYKHKKIKEKIIKVLNGDSLSIQNKNIKIKFAFNLTL